jgi:hypothetical protein
VVQSYTLTTISSSFSTATSAKAFVLDDTQSYAYATDNTGVIYKIDMATGVSTTIMNNGAGNCYAIGLYSIDQAPSGYSQLLFGGFKEMYNYNSLTTGGTKTKPFSITGYGGTYTISGYNFWPNAMVNDATNKIMYISDTNDVTTSSSAGAIWKLVFSSAFAASSLTKLALTLGGTGYTPGTPNGMSLKGSTLYFVEETGNKVCKVDVGTFAVTQIITTGITRPFGIAVDSAEAYAYVSTDVNPALAILKVDLSVTNSFTNIATVPATVYAITLNTAGTHIIMTSGNDLIKDRKSVV